MNRKRSLLITSPNIQSHCRLSGRLAIAACLLFAGQCAWLLGESTPSVPTPTPSANPSEKSANSRFLLETLDSAFADVFEKAAPSVVVIEVTRPPSNNSTFNPFGGFPFGLQPDAEDEAPDREPGRPDFEGSGFLIRPDGFILTNDHVVADASSIRVRLKDGSFHPAKVVGRDAKTDIALIKIEATDLPALELLDSDKIRVGQIACAIGAPYALDYTLTVGWVSAKGRTGLQSRMGTGVRYEDYIQTDASINPGNSGGPLLNIDGKVMGMNTLIHGIQRGLGFAIPSNMLREISTQLMEKGRVIRPWLGIGIESVAELREEVRRHLKEIEEGVVVVSVRGDGPAYKSDLMPSDVIVAINGEKVATALDLQKSVLRKAIGETVILDVFRNGKPQKISVTTAEMDADLDSPPRIPDALPDSLPSPEPSGDESSETPGDSGTGKSPTLSPDAHGLQVQPLTPELARELGVNSTKGVVITDVADGGLASLARLQRGDVITEIDSRPVSNPEEFEAALKAGDTSRGVLLYFDRRGDRSFAVLKRAAAGPEREE